jgi:hypothetical protein
MVKSHNEMVVILSIGPRSHFLSPWSSSMHAILSCDICRSIRILNVVMVVRFILGRNKGAVEITQGISSKS